MNREVEKIIMINVVIADDIQIIRDGLKTVIEQDKDIRVCGLAENGQEAYNLCKKHSPDLVIMDMSMPKMDGGIATKNIKRDFPQIKVLVITTFDDKYTINSALSNGADGYILKNLDKDKLLYSIRTTLSGICVMGEEVFNKIKPENNNDNEAFSNISEREREVLVLLANGLSNKEIAEKLYISVGTAKNHISNLLEKLSLKDRTQLAVFATKNDLI